MSPVRTGTVLLTSGGKGVKLELSTLEQMKAEAPLRIKSELCVNSQHQGCPSDVLLWAPGNVPCTLAMGQN